MGPNLDMELRAKLADRKGDWPAIAKRAQLSYSWLCKFAVGRIPNPGYDSLKKLSAAIAERARVE